MAKTTKKPVAEEVEYDDGRKGVYRVTMPSGLVIELHADSKTDAVEKALKAEADDRETPTPVSSESSHSGKA